MARLDPQLPADLAELATDAGLLLRFDSAEGTSRVASESAVRATLEALGIPAANKSDVAAGLAARRSDAASLVIEPVVAVRRGEAMAVPMRLPTDVSPDRSWVVIEHEDGNISHHRMSALCTASRGGQHRLLDLHRINTLEPGYHMLMIEAPGLTVRSQLLVAPRCPAPARTWGAFMPLHALRSENDWGVGSYRDMTRLAEWIGGLGGGFLGALPLYPLADSPPIDPSPYLPLSKLAYNELYTDLTASPELPSAPEAQQLLENTEFRRQIMRLRMSSLVDYEGVAKLKRPVCEALSRSLISSDSSRRDHFVQFSQNHPELVAYAVFRAEFEGATGSDERAAVNYHLYAQWLASEQLTVAASTVPLYGDLPIGVRADGFDPQWSPDSFVKGVHGGAPPDAFFEGGQNWGFRPLHPERIRRDGYRYLIDCLRRACRHADILRIDHAAGLHRLYWIPDGMDAIDGVYVQYRHEELRAVVCIEAERSGTAIVGEDLGTVPEPVRAGMAEDRMLRSWVLQFETSAACPLPDPPRRSMASWATHDLPRFTAYFEGVELEGDTVESRDSWRQALRLAVGRDAAASAGSVLGGVLEHLAGGPADLVLVDLEELWGEEAPQNLPGTGPEAGNWRRRSEITLDEMRAEPVRPRLLSNLSRLRDAETMPVLETAS